MYRYRKLTSEEQEAVVQRRRLQRYPWHSPPHLAEPGRFRIITGACYEHAPLLDRPLRLQWFENELLQHLKNQDIECAAWVVLPNHYHVLVRIEDIKGFCLLQGELHGRTSFEMNRCDETPGRTVWYRCQDRCMRTEAHYYATINYIHNNPVKHGHVRKWGDWPYSSFHWYLENKGRDWLLDLWQDYPVLNYGDKWDL